jgi:hypothetical protein
MLQQSLILIQVTRSRSIDYNERDPSKAGLFPQASERVLCALRARAFKQKQFSFDINTPRKTPKAGCGYDSMARHK